MTWTKLDEDFPERFVELSDAAFRLHVAATVYVNRFGLDGALPRKRLERTSVPQRSRRPAIVRELVEAGLWQEAADGWMLRDFFDAQWSAEEVTKQREYDAARQRKRFARTDQERQVRAAEERESRLALFDARERRRTRASQRESQGESQRPVPFRTVSSRSVPNENEDENDARPVALSGAGPASGSGNDCLYCAQPFVDNDRIYLPDRGAWMHESTCYRTFRGAA